MNSLCVCDAYGMCPAGCPHCDVCSGTAVSDGDRPVFHSGGLITGSDGSDSVPVVLMRGEHVYDADGKRLL